MITLIIRKNSCLSRSEEEVKTHMMSEVIKLHSLVNTDSREAVMMPLGVTFCF